jgi:hypothetical protein
MVITAMIIPTLVSRVGEDFAGAAVGPLFGVEYFALTEPLAEGGAKPVKNRGTLG